MSTKPGFILTRYKQLFNQDLEKEQQRVVYNRFIAKRNTQEEKSCYCGHTTDCVCRNPSFEEFKHNLLNNNIEENNLP